MTDTANTTDTTTEPATTDTPTTEPKTSKRQMSFTILESGDIQASFGEGIDPLTLKMADVPETVQMAAIAEGLISRARSYTSRLVDESRTPAKLAEVISTAFDNLRKGIWKMERGEGSADTFTIDEEAAHIFRVKRGEKKNEPYTLTIAESAAAWNTLTDDQRKTAKTTALFQLAVAEVKARRNAEKIAKLQKAVEEDTSGF